MNLTTREIGGIGFWLVGAIQPQRTAEGQLWEYSHPLPDGVRPNRHSAGPFCKFSLPAAPRAAGVYAVTVDDELRYLGECEDLAGRFGTAGYGHISPRNCHDDGQSTNCKLNSRVLAAAKAGKIAHVWFHRTDDREAIECSLIATLAPDWNERGATHRLARDNANFRKQDLTAGATRAARRLGADTAKPRAKAAVRSASVASSVGSAVFRRALQARLSKAEQAGLVALQVSAGDLHREVGGYPGNDHRMPSCCAALRAEMQSGDVYTYAPPKGNGASLTIEFRLPRRQP